MRKTSNSLGSVKGVRWRDAPLVNIWRCICCQALVTVVFGHCSLFVTCQLCNVVSVTSPLVYFLKHTDWKRGTQNIFHSKVIVQSNCCLSGGSPQGPTGKQQPPCLTVRGWNACQSWKQLTKHTFVWALIKLWLSKLMVTIEIIITHSVQLTAIKARLLH